MTTKKWEEFPQPTKSGWYFAKLINSKSKPQVVRVKKYLNGTFAVYMVTQIQRKRLAHFTWHSKALPEPQLIEKGVHEYQWHTAPEWAQYAVTLKDGRRYWLEKEPTLFQAHGDTITQFWVFGKGQSEFIDDKGQTPHWQNSLRTKPIEKEKQNAEVRNDFFI